ncbi:hypothetical protein D3C80_1588920 [compost metagenome]
MFPLWQDTATGVAVKVKALGSVIVMVFVVEQEFSSVTVTVYIPAVRPVAVAAVPPDGAHR